MHPDLPFAVARTHQHEMLRHADEARRGAELRKRDRGAVRFSLPHLEISRRFAAVRMRIAHA